MMTDEELDEIFKGPQVTQLVFFDALPEMLPSAEWIMKYFDFERLPEYETEKDQIMDSAVFYPAFQRMIRAWAEDRCEYFEKRAQRQLAAYEKIEARKAGATAKENKAPAEPVKAD